MAKRRRRRRRKRRRRKRRRRKRRKRRGVVEIEGKVTGAHTPGAPALVSHQLDLPSTTLLLDTDQNTTLLQETKKTHKHIIGRVVKKGPF